MSAGYQLCQRGEPYPVGRLVPYPSGVSAQHCVLVSEHQQLGSLVFRGDLAKDAELLVLRHENAVLRRHARRIRYEPTDRVWFTALAQLIPRQSSWARVFP